MSLLRLSGACSGDGEGDFLNAFAADEVENANDCSVGSIFVSADVNGDVGVDAEFVGEVFVEVRQVHLLFLNIDVADFVDGDIDDVGLEIALGHSGGGQIHFDGLQFHHTQACEHEGSEQKEHDVDQGNDLDARFSVGEWGADFHGENVMRDAWCVNRKEPIIESCSFGFEFSI